MKRWRYLLWGLLAVPLPVLAQSEMVGLEAAVEEILTLTGETDIESLDVSLAERFAHYRAHPLRINDLSRSRLLSSGLLTPYQVATLLDYRSSQGDILSAGELELIDGFGPVQTKALTPFVSFASDRLPGAEHQESRFGGEVTLRGGWMGDSYNTGLRLNLNRTDRWEIGLAARTQTGETLSWRPSGRSAFLAYYGRRHLGQLIIGDFNARFGQGLALWNGFGLSGVATPAAFIRRPTGLSVSRSYAGSGWRGLAMDWNFGRWTMTAFSALHGPSGGNVAWYGRYGQVSATGFVRSEDLVRRMSSDTTDVSSYARAALDARFCLRGVDLFAEVARDLPGGSVAAVGGLIFPVGDGRRMALLVRHYPAAYSGRDAGAVRSSTKVSDEEGAAIAWENRSQSVSLDAAWHPSKQQGQFKLVTNGTLLTRGPWTWKYRFTGRYRSAEPRLRADFRTDLAWTQGEWTLDGRTEVCYSQKAAFLVYAEAGRKSGNHFVWLRGTAFRVDDWESRIYAYERNAPGTFSVPSYYGRGYSLAVYAGRKGKHWSVWLQGSLLAYPWMEKQKPGKAGLRLQVTGTW